MSKPRSPLLSGSVVAVRGTRVTISNSCAIRIEGRVPSHINAAVVSVHLRIFDPGFQALDRRSGMNKGRTAVRAHDEIRRKAEDVAASAIAPIIIADKPEVFEDLEVSVQFAAAAAF